MTAPENFVSRWARLKRNSDLQRTTQGVTATPTRSASDVSAGSTEAAISQPRTDAATTDELFDPAGLPSIEAITADTDIRGFLQNGVPAELVRAALRQAWASDPAIRNFVGIAENQWDFNDPNAMPGFGPLPERDSAPALIAQALGSQDNLAEMIPEMPLAAERFLPTATLPKPNDLDQSAQPTFDASPSNNIRGLRGDRNGEGVAVDNDPVAEGDEPRRNRRSHGSALPR
jgi:Protein of unknown function (DUF3306)